MWIEHTSDSDARNLRVPGMPAADELDDEDYDGRIDLEANSVTQVKKEIGEPLIENSPVIEEYDGGGDE